MSEGGKRGNKWLVHVKKTMKAHKGLKFGQVLKLAKKTYGGGGDGVQPHSSFGAGADLAGSGLGGAPAAGGSRRRSRRGRRSRGRRSY